MLLKLGPLAMAAAGSAGGMTLQRSPYGTVARVKPLPANPSTPVQGAVRSRVGQLGSTWRALSQQQRDAWDLFAQTVPWYSRFGDPVRGSGWLAFLRVNANTWENRITRDTLPIITVPPNATATLLPAQIGAQQSPLAIDLWLTSADQSVDPDTTLVVFASPVRSVALAPYHVPKRFIAMLSRAPQFPINLTTHWRAKWGTLPSLQPDQAIYLTVRLFHVVSNWPGITVHLRAVGQ